MELAGLTGDLTSISIWIFASFAHNMTRQLCDILPSLGSFISKLQIICEGYNNLKKNHTLFWHIEVISSMQSVTYLAI